MIGATDLEDLCEAASEKWNIPGFGLAITMGSDPMSVTAFGYRDHESSLPFTTSTLFPIASNTKLFIAVAAGLLVQEGKLAYDTPIRDFVPTLRFPTRELDSNVTLRDMLSHRTGLAAQDGIWYHSNYSLRDLFERVRYMRPVVPLRQNFEYNNMLYEAIGHVIALLSGMPWTEYVSTRILAPLGMRETVFDIPAMLDAPDFTVAYAGELGSRELRRIPYYVDKQGSSAAGGIITNLVDMARWLRALCDFGMLNGAQVIPASILQQTLEPAIGIPQEPIQNRQEWEIINPAYGMGRQICAYRGHLLSNHGGGIDGFMSHVAVLPREKIGVAAFALGEHAAGFPRAVAFSVLDKLLGLPSAPWLERAYATATNRATETALAQSWALARGAPIGAPSHTLSDYAGVFEHPAYGAIELSSFNGALRMVFRDSEVVLAHAQYDRFDGFDATSGRAWSVNFLTDPNGLVSRMESHFDGDDMIFVRRDPS